MIPKILHYCWFGGGAMPEAHQRYVAAWQEHFKDYQIISWDENNSPMQLPYMQKALKHQKWANLSNYTRLHAVYEYGGIYLDTDIEVVRSFDTLLNNSCFVGFENNKIDWTGCVNNAIIGAVPHHPFVNELKNNLLEQFDGTEKANLSSPELTTALLKAKGLNRYGEQWIEAVHVYPLEYFYPYAWFESYSPACIKEQTYCIHHWQKSWESEIEKATPLQKPTYLERIRRRLAQLLH